MVFQAYDEELRCTVALKVLKQELAASPTDRARFESEARKAAAIHHDHVVTIHRVGHTPDFALPYFVMEYIDGESLSDRLRRQGALPAREAAELARQVAMGLAAAHARGLVHRDITPANILVEKETGRAKITDFGLSRSLELRSERLTQTGGIVGTPPYISGGSLALPLARTAASRSGKQLRRTRSTAGPGKTKRRSSGGRPGRGPPAASKALFRTGWSGRLLS